MLTYFVAYLCETSERFIRGLSCICPLMSVCFSLPNMQTLHQKHTLPLVRPVFLSGGRILPVLKRKGCLARLVRTSGEVALQEAQYYKRYSRNLLSSIFSMSSPASDEILAWTFAEGYMDCGMMDLLSRLPILGSWRALLYGEVHGRAGCGCSGFLED